MHQPVRDRFAPARPAQPSWTWFGLFNSSLQLFLAMAGGIFSLALYYPRWGFKRFAILCGPIVGIGTMLLLSMYLFARTDVYKFEICIVAIIGALPGLLLYLLLVAWKFRRLALMLPTQFLPPKPYPAV